MDRWILTAGDGSDARVMGGKAAALAKLTAAGLPVPPWFVITPDAFTASLSDSQRHALEQAGDEDAIRAVVESVRPTLAVMDQVNAALQAVAPTGERLAVRSSAVDEDGAGHSFAGQLESYLFVSSYELADRIAAVWRSGFSPRVAAYRRQQGLSGKPIAPAVIVQRMVDPEVAGVAFAADPVSGRRGVAVVSAVFGLASALVNGETDADSYHIDRRGQIVDRRIATKTVSHRSDASQGGVQVVTLPVERAAAATLTDVQAAQVAALVRAVSAHFQQPQDIEWAMLGTQLFLLQSRPITTLHSRPDPDGIVRLWDNSNIAESYSGVTTPLTFSFARRAYEEVYRQFCRILGVPASRIQDEADLFRNMLGLVRGRVYYNLVNWYRLLALLPGYQVNRSFMEQMMGVREPLPESLAPSSKPAGAVERAVDAMRLTCSALGLLYSQVTIERRIKAFNERFERALSAPATPLGDMRLDELVAYYRDLERQLLTRWDAPLVNDFLAMIFFGVLRGLCRNWLDDDQSLHNDLLCGEGGIISTEPPRRVQALARIAASFEDLREALCHAPPQQALAVAMQHAEFGPKLRDYLEQFGDRCAQELKLESTTLQDDPTSVLRAAGHLAQRMAAGESTGTSGDRTLRATAERTVDDALGNRRLKSKVFSWVLDQTRARVQQRENLRFQRTRLFGRVRRIMVELGRRLYAERLLDDPRDVFYLEVEEVLGLAEGTATTWQPAALARARKAQFAEYQHGDAPPDRFQTTGAVAIGAIQAAPAGPAVPPEVGQVLRGQGACAGIVMGPARVVADPRHVRLQRGEILVAQQTDPGWIMLLASAAGLVVQRGSQLSHSAIVAREMGIPAVVGVANLVSVVQDGQWLQLDGGSGEVRLINPPPGKGEPAPISGDDQTSTSGGGKLTIDVQ
jgi:pyruvate,water dikinase